MSNYNSETFPISQDLDVRRPISEKGFTVMDTDWSYLGRKISQIDNDSNIYHTLGSIALGVAGSALIGAITFPGDTLLYGLKGSVFCCLISVLFFICGGTALHFSQEQRKLLARSKEDALEEMRRIEQRCNLKYKVGK